MKTILGNFVFINEENKSKEIQGKDALSFAKFVLGGFVWGGLAWGVLSGGFRPDTYWKILGFMVINVNYH